MTNPNEDTSVDARAYNRNLMNNVVRLPLVVTQAHEMIIETNTGPLLDFWGDEGVCSLGYNTPEVTQAILGFMATGAPHQLPDVYPHPYRWQAAELLCARTGMDRAFFANSGAEANEGAIKLARKYWWDDEGRPMDCEFYVGHTSGEQRSKPSERYAATAKRHVILTVEGNFHGRTGNAMASGDFRVSPYHRHGFGPGSTGFGVISLIYNGGVFSFKQVVTDGKEHEPREPDWDTVAAIIMAPVLGNNVVTTYNPEFWAAIQKVREEHGVLLIFDDVQAGSGRAGYFATWQHPDCQIQPDIMTLAKGVAMGFPMSVLLAGEHIAMSFTPGTHFNTFGGSPFVCWMAVKMIEWLDDNIENVRRCGNLIRSRFHTTSWIKEYDGWGMLNAFTPDWRHGYDGYAFIHEARKHGLSLVTHRPHGPIRFTPPLNTSVAALNHAFRAMDKTHAALARG